MEATMIIIEKRYQYAVKCDRLEARAMFEDGKLDQVAISIIPVGDNLEVSRMTLFNPEVELFEIIACIHELRDEIHRRRESQESASA
jgi:hypothetical protein